MTVFLSVLLRSHWRLCRVGVSRALSTTTSAALQDLAGQISSGRRVLFITGAGLSAASGIPTYRGSDDAIWTRYMHEWGTRRKFWADPLRWYNEFWLPTHALTLDSVRKGAQAKGLSTVSLRTTSAAGAALSALSAHVHPNAGHEALNQIAAVTNVHIITQNVDGLHTVGMDADTRDHRYIEAHGRADHYRCPPLEATHPSDMMRLSACVYSDEEVLTAVELPLVLSPGEKAPHIEKVPSCPACGTPLMPAVLLFDEMYTDHKVFAFDRILKWLYLAEVLVFVGTSNSVGLTQKAWEVGQQRGIPMYDFNIEDSAFPEATEVFGAAEDTLPELFQLLQRRKLAAPRPAW
eukprot:EG_transcript_10458